MLQYKNCYAKFDPRVPHPRKLITKNYSLLAGNPRAAALFPRENLIASSRRLPNLGEILSSTVQSAKARPTDEGSDQPPPPAGGQHGPDQSAREGEERNRGIENSEFPCRRQDQTHQSANNSGNGGPPTQSLLWPGGDRGEWRSRFPGQQVTIQAGGRTVMSYQPGREEARRA